MQNNFLDKLGFTTDNGLVHHLGEAQNHVERLYIEEAKLLSIPVSAVYFRRFYKNDGDEKPHFSTPAVCIFYQSDLFFNTKPHKILHAELWSAGKTEIYIILGETRVDIINARKPAKRDDDDVTLDSKDLLLVQEAIRNFEGSRFSAHLFGSGTFWEQSEFQEKIDEKISQQLQGIRPPLKIKENESRSAVNFHQITIVHPPHQKRAKITTAHKDIL